MIWQYQSHVSAVSPPGQDLSTLLLQQLQVAAVSEPIIMVEEEESQSVTTALLFLYVHAN